MKLSRGPGRRRARRPADVEVDRARLRQPRASRRARCSSACPGFTRDGHDFAPDAVARGAVALVVERPLGLGVPEVVVDDVRAAMAPGRRALLRRPDGARCASSASPARTARRRRRSSCARCSRRPGVQTGPARHGQVGRRRRRARRWCARRPRRSTSSATFARDARRRRRARARWRSPRTRSSCTAPTRSTGPSRSSRTSPRTTSTSTRRWRTTSSPSGGCSRPGRGVAVVNVDDPYGAPARRRARPTPSRFGDRRADADYRATRRRRATSSGSTLHVRRARPVELRSPLPGRFNVLNALGARRRGARARRRRRDDRRGAARAPARVPGRFEPVDEGQAFAVLVDYAHTPDSLENVLRAARDARPTGARASCVFGAAATATAASAR